MGGYQGVRQVVLVRRETSPGGGLSIIDVNCHFVRQPWLYWYLDTYKVNAKQTRRECWSGTYSGDYLGDDVYLQICTQILLYSLQYVPRYNTQLIWHSVYRTFDDMNIDTNAEWAWTMGMASNPLKFYTPNKSVGFQIREVMCVCVMMYHTL